MKWKTVRNIDDTIPRGLVLTQVRTLDIVSSTEGSIRAMMRMNPNRSMIVCDVGGTQKILEIGRDVIPFSRGVGDSGHPGIEGRLGPSFHPFK
jgi:hypothetical protein